MVQGDNKHLSSLLHQRLPVVREEQVVVGDAVAHRVVGTHGVEERGEERQCVSAGESGAELQGCSPGPASQATEGAAELLGLQAGTREAVVSVSPFMSRKDPPYPCMELTQPGLGWSKSREIYQGEGLLVENMLTPFSVLRDFRQAVRNAGERSFPLGSRTQFHHPYPAPEPQNDVNWVQKMPASGSSSYR